MTVQPSVTVWTILCFLALMLILERLLFRPVLSLLDKRREKIGQAKEEKERVAREREEEIARLRDEHEKTEKGLLRAASDELERIRRENERRVAEKRAENEARLAEERGSLAEESARILKTAAERSDELAAAFVERLSFGSEWDNSADTSRP